MGRSNKRPGMSCTKKGGAAGRYTASGTCRKIRKDRGRKRGDVVAFEIDRKGRQVWSSERSGALFRYSANGRKVYLTRRSRNKDVAL